MIRSRVPAKLPTGALMNSNPVEKSALEPCFCFLGSTVWSLRCAFMITVFHCVVKTIRLRISRVDVESVSDVAPFVEAIASRLEALKVGTEFRPAWLFSSAESRSRRDCFDDNRWNGATIGLLWNEPKSLASCPTSTCNSYCRPRSYLLTGYKS